MESYSSLLGGLHIEQSILVIHGKLIDGSELREILNTNELSIIGTSVAVDVNDIKRVRYYLQVVVDVNDIKRVRCCLQVVVDVNDIKHTRYYLQVVVDVNDIKRV